MPSRVRIQLDLEHPEQVQTQDLHYHMCRWLECDAASHRSAQKPFAISPLTRNEHNQYSFEAGLLDDGLLNRLWCSAARDFGRTLTFGRTAGTVSMNGFELLGTASYLDLLEAAEPVKTWTVHALSPTLWRDRNDDLPFPRAGSLIVGLTRRWGAWSPLALDPSTTGERRTGNAAVARLAITDFAIEGASLTRDRRTRRGFVGRVDLATDEPCNAARARVDALLHFAEYAGVGSMTPYGFGVVAVASRPAKTVSGGTALPKLAATVGTTQPDAGSR